MNISWSPRKCTPQKSPPKKRSRNRTWSQQELRSLVEYVALHKDAQNSENEWPAMNDDNNYWFKTSEFIKQTCGTVRGSKYLYIFVCIHREHNF